MPHHIPNDSSPGLIYWFISFSVRISVGHTQIGSIRIHRNRKEEQLPNTSRIGYSPKQCMPCICSICVCAREKRDVTPIDVLTSLVHTVLHRFGVCQINHFNSWILFTRCSNNARISKLKLIIAFNYGMKHFILNEIAFATKYLRHTEFTQPCRHAPLYKSMK